MPGIVLAAVEEYVRTKRSQNRRNSANVVAMRMREQNCIDVMDTLTDEKRYDDFLADQLGVRVRLAGFVTFEAPAGVDHDRVSARGLDENPVALPDVDEGNSEIVARHSRRPQNKRTREHRDRERRKLESHASLSRQSLERQSTLTD